MKTSMKIGELLLAMQDFKQIKLENDKEILVKELGVKIKKPNLDYEEINYIIKKQTVGKVFVFDNQATLSCADKHILYNKHNMPIFAENLMIGDFVRTIFGFLRIVEKRNLITQDFYDIGIASPHVYCDSNGIVHHNTVICGILSHKIEKYGRSIIIVPTKDLVTQTEEDYINLGLDVGVFFGDRKEYLKTHTICTWQSLQSLLKKSKKEELEIDIDKFFENVVCVIGDECHRISGQVLQDLLSIPLRNVPIRWGLTGTMPETDMDKIAILSVIGPEINKITTKELQDKGILAHLNINVWQLQDLAAPMVNDYQVELKWLTTNKPRIDFIAQNIIKISESGSTLVLVDRVETGKMLQLLISDSVFVSGAMKSKDRKAEYKEVNEVDGKVIIATSGVASTGINIPRIYNLVLFECGKSFIKVIQSIGRSIRVTEDKDHAEIYDICSNTKYSKRHLTARKKIYKDAEYPFTIKKVNY
jgi:superfamily II DNA or RNA helicase